MEKKETKKRSNKRGEKMAAKRRTIATTGRRKSFPGMHVHNQKRSGKGGARKKSRR